MVAEPSVNPRFPPLLVLTSSLRASLQPIPSVLFYLYFFPTSGFLNFVNEDALDFSIAPSVSDSALGLRNRIHLAEPLPAPVLSPPPSPAPATLTAPYQVLSLAPVLSSSSSLSSESNKSDDDDSPLCLGEASSSVFFAYKSTVSSRLSYKSKSRTFLYSSMRDLSSVKAWVEPTYSSLPSASSALFLEGVSRGRPIQSAMSLSCFLLSEVESSSSSYLPFTTLSWLDFWDSLAMAADAASLVPFCVTFILNF